MKGDVKMEFELNELVERFTNISIRVEGVYNYKIDPGTAGWQKAAPFPGFIFPLRGKAQYRFDGTPYTASIGRVVHGGASMGLDKQVLGDTKWEYISVLYDIRTSETKGICLPEVHFELTPGNSPRLQELLGRLYRTFNQPGSIPAFQAENLFRCVLEEVFVCARNQTNHGAQVLFEQVSSYIQDHFMDSLTVHGLAEQNEVTENRLFYVFSKYAGMGPGDYLIACRLNRAKELLTTIGAPVSEVAKSIGYSDPLYFSRSFRKRFKMSPSEFREKFRNNP